MANGLVNRAAAGGRDPDDPQHRVLHLPVGARQRQQQIIPQLYVQALDEGLADDHCALVTCLQITPLVNSAHQPVELRLGGWVHAQKLDAGHPRAKGQQTLHSHVGSHYGYAFKTPRGFKRSRRVLQAQLVAPTLFPACGRNPQVAVPALGNSLHPHGLAAAHKGRGEQRNGASQPHAQDGQARPAATAPQRAQGVLHRQIAARLD